MDSSTVTVGTGGLGTCPELTVIHKSVESNYYQVKTTITVTVMDQIIRIDVWSLHGVCVCAAIRRVPVSLWKCKPITLSQDK